MTRHLLPVVLTMTLLGPLLAVSNAAAEDLPAARNDKARFPAAPSTDGRIAVTRSDGSTGYTKPPDAKAIRKLVSYMRLGMNRADRSERQRQTRRPTRRIWIRK